MSNPAEYFTAYYMEYPDLGIATIVQIRPEGPSIATANPINRKAWLESLRGRGQEVFAFTSEWEEVDGLTRRYRRWHPIALETVPS